MSIGTESLVVHHVSKDIFTYFCSFESYEVKSKLIHIYLSDEFMQKTNFFIENFLLIFFSIENRKG